MIATVPATHTADSEMNRRSGGRRAAARGDADGESRSATVMSAR